MVRSVLAIGAVLLAGCIDGHRSYYGKVEKPAWRVDNLSARLLQIHDGILYARASPAGSDKGPHLYAFDVRNGKQLWQSDFVADYPDSLTLSGGVLYIMGFPEGTDRSVTRRLHAIDRQSGKPLWESKVVVDQLNYVLSTQLGVNSGRAARILDPITGADSPAVDPAIILNAAVAQDVVYTAGANARVRALTSTETLWTASLPEGQFEGPVLAGDNIYFYCVSPQDSKGCQTPGGAILPEWGIYAFHKKTGELRWKWRPDDYRLSGMAADGDTVYISAWNHAGIALALDAATGQTKWEHPLQWSRQDQYFRRTYRAPFLFDLNTVVYFDQSSSQVAIFDRDNLGNKEQGTVVRAYRRSTGAPLWESKLRWKYDGWVANDGLLFASDSGPNSWRTSNYRHNMDTWFTALDLRKGTELWRSAAAPLSTLSAPLAGGGMVVVATGAERSNPRPVIGIMAFRQR